LSGVFGVTRLIRAFLFGVGARDSTAILTAAVVLAAVAAMACYDPAPRVTRIDPIEALRLG
jgi:hypothetical protein